MTPPHKQSPTTADDALIHAVLEAMGERHKTDSPRWVEWLKFLIPIAISAFVGWGIVNARFSSVEARVDAVQQRFDDVKSDITEMRQDIKTLLQRSR